MKLTVLILVLLLAAGCKPSSESLTPRPGTSQKTVPSLAANKWAAVHVRAVVTRMLEFNPVGNTVTFSVEDGDVRFILYLDVVSVDPSTGWTENWFKPGRSADFGIHDPENWFGTDQEEEIVGNSYQFVIAMAQALLPGMKRRSTLVSVEGMNAEPDTPTDADKPRR